MHINVQFLRRVVKFRRADLSTFIVSRATVSRSYDRRGKDFIVTKFNYEASLIARKASFLSTLTIILIPLLLTSAKNYFELHFTSDFYLVTEIAAEILLAKEIVILCIFLLIEQYALYLRKFPEHAS